VIEAAFWGLAGASALLLGAAAGLVLRVPARMIGLSMGFGTGVLIGVLAFNLDEHAYELGGGPGMIIGFAAGALAFFAVDRIVDRRGGADRKRSGGQQSGGSGAAITAGAVIDGIPESVLIGLTLVEGGDIGGAVVAAVFLSNLSEALSGATGLKRAGYSDRWTWRLWTAVLVASGVASALAYGVLNSASNRPVGVTHAFATGAAFCMLADTLLPEAFGRKEQALGAVIALGFGFGFLLSIA
jgi:ZIP family zinc transporter